MGAGETFKYILMQFLFAVAVAVVNGVWVFILIAFVLPYLLSVMFSWPLLHAENALGRPGIKASGIRP